MTATNKLRRLRVFKDPFDEAFFMWTVGENDVESIEIITREVIKVSYDDNHVEFVNTMQALTVECWPWEGNA